MGDKKTPTMKVAASPPKDAFVIQTGVGQILPDQRSKRQAKNGGFLTASWPSWKISRPAARPKSHSLGPQYCPPPDELTSFFARFAPIIPPFEDPQRAQSVPAAGLFIFMDRLQTPAKWRMKAFSNSS